MQPAQRVVNQRLRAPALIRQFGAGAVRRRAVPVPAGSRSRAQDFDRFRVKACPGEIMSKIQPHLPVARELDAVEMPRPPIKRIKAPRFTQDGIRLLFQAICVLSPELLT